MKPPTRDISNIQVGPEIISDFKRDRRAEGRIWAEAYTQTELDTAQARFGLTFPPDLVSLFLERRPVMAWDWRYDIEGIWRMLEWPLEGLLFDVEPNNFRLLEWGAKSCDAEQRAKIVSEALDQAPKLVPLMARRFVYIGRTARGRNCRVLDLSIRRYPLRPKPR